MENTMRFLRTVAILGALATGALGLAGPVAASPLVAAAAPAAGALPGVVAKAQFYAERPIYRPMRPVVRHYPVVRRYPVVRHYRVVHRYPIYRPRPIVRYYPVYRPRPVVQYYPVYRRVRVVHVPPRVVCRTRLRLVRIHGHFERRPVQRCVRRY
jgi:hypothetical protein